jgi:uncharacterized protein YndB with AHSA1/START domain
MMNQDEREERTVVRLSHTVAVPREAVFRAWTEPALLARWWWPPRFATRFALDLRPGGAYSIRSAELPDLGVLAISGTFLEVDAPERLVYTWRLEGLDPTETLVTVKFSEAQGQTTIELVHERFARTEEAENNRAGWQSCLDRLTAAATEGALQEAATR